MPEPRHKEIGTMTSTPFLTTKVETPRGIVTVASFSVREGDTHYTKTTATYANGKPYKEGRFVLDAFSTDATAVKDHEDLVRRIQ